MFREIRKKKNAISHESAEQLLAEARRGVLSVQGDDGYPYGLPINYVYVPEDAKIYFHGSRAGHKVDSLQRSDKVSFTVIGSETIKEESWAPYVKSVIIFGRCRLISDQAEAIELVRKFANKYYPDSNLVEEEIAMSGKAVQMYEIEIEHISGKEVQER